LREKNVCVPGLGFAINRAMFSQYFLLWIGYIGLLLALGSIFRKKVKSPDDFFFASRQLRAPEIAFSLSASWIGATSILVTTDEASRQGLASLWLVGIPAWLTVMLMALILAGAVRRREGFALQDLLQARYGTLMRRLAGFIIFWYLILLAASQLVALGSFLQIFLEKNYLFSLILGLLAIIIYTSLGGLISVVTNDLFQGGMLLAGIILLFFWLLFRVNQVEASAPLEIASLPFFGLFSNLKTNGLAALSFTLAWLISPIAWQRVQAARTSAEARKGLLLTSAIFALIYPLISFIGLLGQVLASPASPEQPLLARLISKGPLASWLKPFLFITIVAAILSTLDTAINSCCLFLSREIAGRSLKENSARQLRLSRLANVTIGFLAFLVASRFRSILQTIGLASEIMAEGLFIPVMAMFLLRSRFELAGLLSLISGASFACLSFLSGAGIIRTSLPSWPSSLPFGLSLSLLGFGLGLVIARIRDKKIK